MGRVFLSVAVASLTVSAFPRAACGLVAGNSLHVQRRNACHSSGGELHRPRYRFDFAPCPRSVSTAVFLRTSKQDHQDDLPPEASSDDLETKQMISEISAIALPSLGGKQDPRS